LYFGTKDLEGRIEATVFELYDEPDEKGSSVLEGISELKVVNMMDYFFQLYILVDELIDPVMANLVIEELISFSSKHRYKINNVIIADVYESTPDGSPLRKLVRDCNVHDSPSWSLDLPQESWETLPHDFLRDLIVETARMQKAHPQKRVEEIFGDGKFSRPAGFYHQKVEKSKAS
jgi:hypothetical protein